jgi:hypothetical protein
MKRKKETFLLRVNLGPFLGYFSLDGMGSFSFMKLDL